MPRIDYEAVEKNTTDLLRETALSIFARSRLRSEYDAQRAIIEGGIFVRVWLDYVQRDLPPLPEDTTLGR